MVHFAVPPVGRDQLTLFTEKLDDIIDDDHPVRLLDDILEKIDWTAWENSYVLTGANPDSPSISCWCHSLWDHEAYSLLACPRGSHPDSD